MSQEKKRDIHPIVKEALQMAYVGFEPVVFDEEAIEDLKEMLKQYYGQPDLLIAVIDLLNLAHILEKEGSPSAALALIKIVCSATDAIKEGVKK